MKRGWASGVAGGVTPGLTNTPMVTGICLRWMRLSNTTGTRQLPSTFTNRSPSWNTITQAGTAGRYWAGT